MKKIIFPLAMLMMVACGSSSKDKDKNSIAKEQSTQQSGAKAKALLRSPQKEVTGTVYFKQQDNGVLATIMVNGLKPESTHGIHIHQNGKCDGPDFKSAGGHLNPEGFSHAGPQKPEYHLGDLGNVRANDQGIARKDVLIKGSSHAQIEVLVSRAVILHAKKDDLKSDPSGNSGARIACGIIQTL